MLDKIRVGLIVNTHGLKGEVKVLPLTDDVNRFNKLDTVYFENEHEHKISNLKYQNTNLIIKFEDINNIDEAEKYKNTYLQIDRLDAVILEDDSYFIFELIGCEVYTEEGEHLGKIKDILQTGSNDVYILDTNNKEDILIPALKNVVKTVDIRLKKIIVKLPEGLRE